MRTYIEISRGFGFITVPSQSKANDILSSQPHIIQGTKVELKRAFPKELNIQYVSNKSSKTKQKSQDRKIFVGGLPSNANKMCLKNFFSQYGEVEYCIVMTDKATDKPRGIYSLYNITIYIGFGFVVFKELSSVDFCLKDTPNHRLYGKWIECKRANPKDKYEDEDSPQTATENNTNPNDNDIISRQNSNNSNTTDNPLPCSLSYSEYLKNQIPKNNKNKTPDPTSQSHSTPISKYKYNFRHIGENLDKYEESYDYKEDECSNLMNLFVYQEDYYQNQNNLKNDLTANIDDNSNMTCYQDNSLFVQKNSFTYKDQVFHAQEIQTDNDDELISLTAQTSEVEDKPTNDNSNIIASSKDKNDVINNKDNNNNSHLKVNFQEYFNNSIQNPNFFSFFHFKLFDINGEEASTLSSYQNTTKITLFKSETESSSSDKDSDHSSNQSPNDSRIHNNASNSLATSSPGSNSITINSNNSKPSLNSSNYNSSKLSDSIVTIGSDYKDVEEEIKHDVNNAYYGPRIHKTFKNGFVNSFRPY